MLHIILDVDGVTRLDVTSAADIRVITLVNRILALEDSTDAIKGKLRFTFLSGSHSSIVDIPKPKTAQSLPQSWRTPNLPLAQVFDKCFPRSAFESGLVSIFGQLGCDTAVVVVPSSPTTTTTQLDKKPNEIKEKENVSLTGQVIHGFDDDERVRLLAIVLHSYGEFLRDTHNFTDAEYEQFLALLRAATYGCIVTSECSIPVDHTPDAFEPVAAFLREKSHDEVVRIISHKGNAEIGVAPKKNAEVDYRRDGLKIIEYIRNKIVNHHDKDVRALADRVSCGVAHLDGGEFIWAVITASNKGIACADLLRRLYNIEFDRAENDHNSNETPVTIITVGDSHVDFSMHELSAPSPSYKSARKLQNVSGGAFHVGPPSTLAKLSKSEPEKFSHVTQVHLTECKSAVKVRCATEEEDARLEHLYGNTDVMSLTTGTLEVLIRLEELLVKKVSALAKGEEINFENLVKELSGSFPQGV